MHLAAKPLEQRQHQRHPPVARILAVCPAHDQVDCIYPINDAFNMNGMPWHAAMA